MAVVATTVIAIVASAVVFVVVVVVSGVDILSALTLPFFTSFCFGRSDIESNGNGKFNRRHPNSSSDR